MADLAWFKGFQFFDLNGNPRNGGLLRTYDATTTNPRTVYKDSGASVPWSQPITLDSSGRLTDAVYVQTGAWKFVLTNSDTTDSITQDNIPGAITIPSAVFAQPELPIITKAADYTIVSGDLGKKINVDATGGDVTISLMSAISAGNGAYVSVQNVGATGSVIVTSGTSINGQSSIVLRAQFDSADVISDGADWWGNISAEKRTTILVSADYTVLRSDIERLIKVNAAAGNVELFLPSATTVGSGVTLEFKKIDSSSNTVLINPNGAQTIDGAGSVTLSHQWQSLVIRCDNTNWMTMSASTVSATTTTEGTIEIATEVEAAARTDNSRAISPFSNPLPPGYLFGLTLSNGTDAVNDIDIAVGMCRDSADDVNILLSSVFTKRLDAAWAVGSGNGGLDTGAIANTTYYVHLIKRSDTQVVDALFSTSASAPTMPTNYTDRRRIGALLREGGSIVAFRQDGDKFWRSTPVEDVNAVNPGTSAVTRTLSVPVGLPVNAMVTHGIVDQSTNTNMYGLLTALADTNTTPTVSLRDVAIVLVGADEGGAGTSYREVTTNTSAQIRSRITVSGANTRETIATLGWIDQRGRLA